MNRWRWIIILRLSPYIFFVLASGLLLVFAPRHIDSRFATFAFAIGLVLFVVSRIVGRMLLAADVRENQLRLAPLGEMPDIERPVDADRVRAALSRLDEFPDGSPAWLRPAVDSWLAAAPGADKNRMRDELLQRLYAEAGTPGDLQQRRALNEVRLAINPWARET